MLNAGQETSGYRFQVWRLETSSADILLEINIWSSPDDRIENLQKKALTLLELKPFLLLGHFKIISSDHHHPNQNLYYHLVIIYLS